MRIKKIRITLYAAAKQATTNKHRAFLRNKPFDVVIVPGGADLVPRLKPAVGKSVAIIEKCQQSAGPYFRWGNNAPATGYKRILKLLETLVKRVIMIR